MAFAAFHDVAVVSRAKIDVGGLDVIGEFGSFGILENDSVCVVGVGGVEIKPAIDLGGGFHWLGVTRGSDAVVVVICVKVPGEL